MLWFDDGGLLDYWDLARERQHLQQENEQLAERNQVLEAELTDLRVGLEGVEEQAREQLGLIRKGEEFYQLVDPLPALDPVERPAAATP